MDFYQRSSATRDLCEVQERVQFEQFQCCLQQHCTQYNSTQYEVVVNQYYKEPVDGKFEYVTATVLNDIDSDRDKETVAIDDEPMAATIILLLYIHTAIFVYKL